MCINLSVCPIRFWYCKRRAHVRLVPIQNSGYFDNHIDRGPVISFNISIGASGLS